VRRAPNRPVDINAFAEERLEALLGPACATEAMASSLRILDLSRLTTPAQLGAFGQLLMDQEDRNDGREIVGALLVLHAASLMRWRRESARAEVTATAPPVTAAAAA
jgi:hypothetical protein